MKLPEMTPVESSNIKAIGFEGTNLFVEYLTGRMYRYKEVPQQIFEGLKAAESKGRFMNTTIKNKFEYEAYTPIITK